MIEENFAFILSLDIGGANTKAALLFLDMEQYKNNTEIKNKERYKNILTACEVIHSETLYFPFWTKINNEFFVLLEKIKNTTNDVISKFISERKPDVNYTEILDSSRKFLRSPLLFRKKSKRNSNPLILRDSVKQTIKKSIEYDIVITITAELSDAFNTKQEGIITICNNLESVFSKKNLKFINVNSEFVDIEEAKSNYLSVSASNWIATSLVLGEREKLGLLLDMGSTTLDLIPIKDGKPVTLGKNDVDRLLNSELFYTGILRPPVSTVVKTVPFRNSKCPISFEKFALMADVYLILGKITPEQYFCDTADNRGKSLDECYARLSRIVCGDPLIITKDELDIIAEHIYNTQKKIVKEAIRQVIDQFIRRFITPISKIRFNVTGLGSKILLLPALKELDIKDNQIFFKFLSEKEHVLSTAICLGIIYLRKILESKKIIEIEQNEEK